MKNRNRRRKTRRQKEQARETPSPQAATAEQSQNGDAPPNAPPSDESNEDKETQSSSSSTSPATGDQQDSNQTSAKPQQVGFVQKFLGVKWVALVSIAGAVVLAAIAIAVSGDDRAESTSQPTTSTAARSTTVTIIPANRYGTWDVVATPSCSDPQTPYRGPRGSNGSNLDWRPLDHSVPITLRVTRPGGNVDIIVDEQGDDIYTDIGPFISLQFCAPKAVKVRLQVRRA